MIRDLQEEVRQIRNLAEAAAQAAIQHADSTGSEHPRDRNLRKVKQKYQEYRCDRFAQEVKDAEAVLEKNYRCNGHEITGAFVPRILWDELIQAHRKLEQQYTALKEKNLRTKKITKGKTKCHKKI